ncbi:MAG: F0F1 ATP synthase subunit delta [bacterium]|nr:F0F1 ATP synthase subunit delta [bacterium]
MIIEPKLKADLKAYLLDRLKTKKVAKVVIRAPYMLGDQEIDMLKQRIEMLHQATIYQEVDEKILAGCIIQFGSQVIDLSLNRQLQTLEHILYETV